MHKRLSLVLFRLELVTVVLASCHLAALLTRYLYFDRIVQAANAVVRLASFWVIDSLTALGALVLGAEFARTSGTYATRAALMAMSYFFAFAVLVLPSTLFLRPGRRLGGCDRAR